MQIALYRGQGFISKLIEWQSRGGYSHASVVLPNGAVIESKEFKGVRRLPEIDKDPGEVVDIFEVETTSEQDQSITAFLYAQVGKPYDYTMVARFVTRQQYARTSSGKWFCSELVFAAFKQAGIDLLARTEPWEVSPAMLGRSPLLKAVVPRVYQSTLP